MTILHFDVIDSTHHYCQLLDLRQVEELSLFWVDSQTAGVGQRGNRWESQPGRNLTFSFVLHPSFLPPQQQFLLTEAMSVAVSDWLLSQVDDVHVKWPNDIYVGRRKLCGTLLEARIAHGRFESAICSMGVNINQMDFPEWVPNPVSLAQLTGCEYRLEECLDALVEHLEHCYAQLREGNGDQLHRQYLERLLQRGEECTYRYHDRLVRATILDVNQYGHLLLSTADGERLSCQMKEVTYLW
ncbi:MAG: biotin--[Bacteroidales bacterium]|nr:biotin--[acetyl-CoA-carboxylase] ligase [Bacteroidales bacterium]